MENSTVDSVEARLMETNDAFRTLAQQHSEYDRRIEELTSRKFPTAEEQEEEARLKREKLLLKDKMSNMVREYQQTH